MKYGQCTENKQLLQKTPQTTTINNILIKRLFPPITEH